MPVPCAVPAVPKWILPRLCKQLQLPRYTELLLPGGGGRPCGALVQQSDPWQRSSERLPCLTAAGLMGAWRGGRAAAAAQANVLCTANVCREQQSISVTLRASLPLTVHTNKQAPSADCAVSCLSALGGACKVMSTAQCASIAIWAISMSRHYMLLIEHRLDMKTNSNPSCPRLLACVDGSCRQARQRGAANLFKSRLSLASRTPADRKALLHRRCNWQEPSRRSGEAICQGACGARPPPSCCSVLFAQPQHRESLVAGSSSRGEHSGAYAHRQTCSFSQWQN